MKKRQPLYHVVKRESGSPGRQLLAYVAAVVLALLAGFVLFCAGWQMARSSAPEPYRVTTAQRPPAADGEAASIDAVSEEDPRPDSLLPGEVVDINTADAYDLRRLPGIGEKRAAAIIADRERNGPFRFPEEISRVEGIGEETLAECLEYITTEDVEP